MSRDFKDYENGFSTMERSLNKTLNPIDSQEEKFKKASICVARQSFTNQRFLTGKNTELENDKTKTHQRGFKSGHHIKEPRIPSTVTDFETSTVITRSIEMPIKQNRKGQIVSYGHFTWNRLVCFNQRKCDDPENCFQDFEGVRYRRHHSVDLFPMHCKFGCKCTNIEECRNVHPDIDRR